MKISTVDVRVFLAEARDTINQVLLRWGERARREMGGHVGAAVEYALQGPGKRLRPALVIASYQELGGAGDIAEVAAAVEVVHTYSLVHDDLPCMDDDDLRRGRPTTHRRFGDAAATAAGFRMVLLAARVLAEGGERLGLPLDTIGQMGRLLFDAAGGRGMVGGQVLDLEAEGRQVTLGELRNIHQRKTGALIEASLQVGALAAGASPEQRQAVRAFGAEIGMAFQIADDVLDMTASSQELGKTAGKDAAQRKATFATVLGLDSAMQEARERTSRAVDLLGMAGIDSLLLSELAQLLVNRRS